MARRSRAHDLPRAQRRRAGSEIVREIVHVVAPNANRFLAEGLAAYAQERLKGQAAFPNYGADAHREVSLLSADPSALAAYVSVLERHATPERLRSDSLDEQQAYLIAGSFVRYLIETVGAEKFRALYDYDASRAPNSRPWRSGPVEQDLWQALVEPLRWNGEGACAMIAPLLSIPGARGTPPQTDVSGVSRIQAVLPGLGQVSALLGLRLFARSDAQLLATHGVQGPSK